jgi:hypothetical protein
MSNTASSNLKLIILINWPLGYSYANDIYCPQVKYDQQGSDYSLGNLTKTGKAGIANLRDLDLSIIADDIGANWVSIIVVWFVKDINSTTILPGKNTATDAQVRSTNNLTKWGAMR